MYRNRFGGIGRFKGGLRGLITDIITCIYIYKILGRLLPLFRSSK